MNWVERQTLAAFIIRQTGWSLEYVRQMPLNDLLILADEFSFQCRVDNYGRLYGAALIVSVMASSRSHQLSPEDIIGKAPERRIKEGDRMSDKIKMADGNEYQLAPITLNLLEAIEDKFGESFDALFRNGQPHAKVLRFLLYLRLRNNYPALTEQQIGEMVTVEALAEVV